MNKVFLSALRNHLKDIFCDNVPQKVFPQIDIIDVLLDDSFTKFGFINDKLMAKLNGLWAHLVLGDSFNTIYLMLDTLIF